MIDTWEDDDCYYFTMQYANANDMFGYIRDKHGKGDLAERVQQVSSLPQVCATESTPWMLEMQRMFAELVDALCWMHSHGVVHLDVSLENTMLMRDPGDEKRKEMLHPVIIDFGLAEYQPETMDEDKRFQFQRRVGKTGYMSPEVDEAVFFFVSFHF